MPQVPGVSATVTVDPSMTYDNNDRTSLPSNPISSVTQNPFVGLEAGRAMGSTTGAATALTLVGTASILANGNSGTMPAFAYSTGGYGVSLSYTVTSGVASVPVIVDAGAGITEGESFTVDGDFGVTFTASIA